MIFLTRPSPVPRPRSEKSRRGLATVPYNGLSGAVCTVRANQVAEFSYMYITLIASWYKLVLCRLTKLWLCLMLPREKMGSRKLLLKQKEVAEAFASWRDAFVSFTTSYTIALLHFHSMDIAKKSLSELQVWLERRETRFTHKPWSIWPFCSYIANNCTGNKTYIPLSLSQPHDLLLSRTM